MDLQGCASYHQNRAASIRTVTVAISSGVPQSSVLGPVLFSIHMLPLGSIYRKYNTSYHCYVLVTPQVHIVVQQCHNCIQTTFLSGSPLYSKSGWGTHLISYVSLLQFAHSSSPFSQTSALSRQLAIGQQSKHACQSSLTFCAENILQIHFALMSEVF